MSTMALAAIGSKRRSRKDVRDGACAIPKSINVLFFICLELKSLKALVLLSLIALEHESL